MLDLATHQRPHRRRRAQARGRAPLARRDARRHRQGSRGEPPRSAPRLRLQRRRSSPPSCAPSTTRCWRARRSATPSDAPRDAIFEVVMSRFDVLAAYKPALKSIAASWPADPALLRALAASQAWMLRAAGVSARRARGQARAAGLGAVYASVFRTWLEDDDPGLARTMAALDRRLRRGERTLKSVEEVEGHAVPPCRHVHRRPQDVPPRWWRRARGGHSPGAVRIAGDRRPRGVATAAPR